MHLAEEYVEIVRRYIDSPEVFVKASAFYLLSACLGKFIRCSGLPQRYPRPNLWFIISSIPGRMRRSTLINITSGVYKNAYFNFMKDVTRMSEKEIWSEVYTRILEEGTQEGIIDHISDTYVPGAMDDYTFLSHEFGNILLKARSREYMMGFLSLLSKLYYGEGGSFYLSRRGKKKKYARILPEGVYVTLFCGMQEPQQYMVDEMIRQGFLRRIIVIYVSPDELSMEDWKPPLMPERENLWIELKKYSEKLGSMMVRFNEIVAKQGIIPTMMSPRLWELINEYAKRRDAWIIRESTEWHIYAQTLWEHLVKLCVLNAVARGSVKQIAGSYMVMADIEDYKQIMNFFHELVEKSKNAISLIGAATRELTMPDATGIFNRVLREIEKSGRDGIPAGTLLAKLGTDKTALKRYIVTLVEMNKIIPVHTGKGVRFFYHTYNDEARRYAKMVEKNMRQKGLRMKALLSEKEVELMW